MIVPTALIGYMALTLLLAAITKVAWKHYNHGNETHPAPYSLHQSIGMALVEVCYDRPRTFHLNRLAAVAIAEEHRADAIDAARLRHPSNFRDRQACMTNHPSNHRSV